jgi:multicomponent K+:H+ antiporter subunit A
MGAPRENDARFFVYLLMFMTSMLGLVLAGDVITLFVFWEGTSIISFLLVAYKYKDEAARAGAFKALFITGGGGIALLAGLALISVAAGNTGLQAILSSGELLRNHTAYGLMLALVAIGAFTKSAQFPAHIWLPDAMSAPTPASAYLHSATMVKAGIYLMARLYPALGGTDAWFWLLTLAGGATLLLGAYLGLRQNDLKALLAYSTISQLGVLMMLIGQKHEEAFKALVIGVLAHALYKGALFLVAGIVDHNTGTRDIRLLGNLRAVMPVTFVCALLAGLSMGGLPPFFGFLAKETLLAAALEETPGIMTVLLPLISVAAGALILAQALMLIVDTFWPREHGRMAFTRGGSNAVSHHHSNAAHDTHADHAAHVHEAPIGMLIGPGVLAALSLLVAVLPFQLSTDFLASAAKAAFGEKVKVSLALWHGINGPLLLSLLAIATGTALFVLRERLFPRTAAQTLTRHPAVFEAPYRGALGGLNWLAGTATLLQGGQIRRYMSLMIIGAGVMFTAFGALTVQPLPLTWNGSTTFNIVRIIGLVLAIGASAASVILRKDIDAILALGASGLAMALLIGVEPSPDVALVQIIVDILTTIVLVLALSKMPKRTETAAARQRGRQRVESNDPLGTQIAWRDAALALAAGVAMTIISFNALSTRPRESIVTPYYEKESKPLTGAADIVGAIVVDFRGFDTMIEISVFSMAGIGVYTLLRYARRKHDLDLPKIETIEKQPLPERIKGIGGWRTSSFVQLLANLALPFALALGAVHILYGHDQPGDGFTAGVIISIAVGFAYLVFGYENTRTKLPWLRSHVLIGLGILTVMAGSLIPVGFGQNFFAPMDFGLMMGLPLPEGVFLSTSTMFEIAICLAVLGSSAYIVDTFNRPEQEDPTAPAIPQEHA